MAKAEEKFIVINRKHIDQLPEHIASELNRSLMIVKSFLPENYYYTCNQDEPYAEEVLDVILNGEDKKDS